MKYGISKMMAMGVVLAGMALSASAADFEMPDSRFIADSRVVDFADLNLDNPAGVATLHQRLRVAARRVCPDLSRDLHDLNGKKRLEQCRLQSLETAIKQLPMVVQVHHRQWLAAGARWLDRSQMPVTLEAAVRR